MTQEMTTLYQEVANHLLKDIEEGVYVVGGLLPTEHELSARFAVSRQTIRSSLTLLQERGYISRKKAVGTRVESLKPLAGYRQVYDSIDDLVKTAAEDEIRVIETVRRLRFDKSAARRLGAAIGSDWIEFAGKRVRSRQPDRAVSAHAVYLDTRFDRVIDLAHAHPDRLISSLLEQAYDVAFSEIRQTISVATLSESAARALGCEPGSSALKLLRHFKDRKGEVLLISETLYPGGRVQISTRIQRALPDV
ncbi:MAG: GntR family transcriptional regulator [Brevundimonas sp.]|jgi:DNA-binding GntR family transcriptional regulator|uniref:GntR family transcriptional regulator n=1 Tax=Brevundimonas sp. TaxID=1871086 RepID=UPI0025C0AD8B|nr:GntR family transcriptional regulator [Brevundimonas sp.]MCH4269691.1 GntR family transcriptional regulator [Brevundimonas sp.]